ncbi:MFS transporter [Pseudoalteromonas sp. McH1-7]|uniref:MFS transporter n=1 Tax=Pseudoalteromonas TaxID=53246 RepID=UPI00159189A7|nr:MULTISPECIES: MFS transporter [Pseudoalteromonas]MDW7550764.1 MFS transporter [Pseudoalteromonas peptidolytica]NUZ11457.1 MFS transporter [Pseudoalteromonas sp. McH1-7]USD28642.1 MFS transporter [Pseudoalteromonas sp. SCSIO 43201]
MKNTSQGWQSPFNFLVLATVVMAVTFAGWMAMLNNFAIEAANFNGANMGMLQSLREIPGFLAFTAVFVLLVLKEQTFALISLCLLSLGVAITGWLPTIYGLYATTVLMSIGFHYFETLNQSLSLQWFNKDEAPAKLGILLSIKSIASLITYAIIWLGFSYFSADYQWMYLLIGGVGFIIALLMFIGFPTFEIHTRQHKKLILRKEYSLYYALIFFSGARRQIFMVFAGFLMVEKFGFDVAQITALYMLNHLVNIFIAPKIGQMIGHIGERKTLTIEYIGLIAVFIGYALVESASFAAALYVIDHLFFAMAIALKTYFQKIARPEDIAATAGVSFTINHIAAVVIPASFGVVWLYDQSLVFYFGAALAVCSLVLSQFVNTHKGQETLAKSV